MVPWLSPDEALDLHRALLIDSLRLLRRAAERRGARPFVSFSEPWEPEAGAELAEASLGLERLPQHGVDLGDRLLRTFRDLLERRRHGSAVIIGSDSPTLPPERLQTALDLLESGAEVVLGPAEDGGYYLIAARRVVPELFAGIPWGTPGVLGATREAIERAGLRAALLPPWYDVDRPADLLRARRDLEENAGALPGRTAVFIGTLVRAGRLRLDGPSGGTPA